MPCNPAVHRPISAIAGVALGVAIARERQARRRAERFSAACLESLLRAIDANDRQTGAHVRRVATYALILADAVGVDEGDRRIIELTALFHDIGKIHEALFDIVHEPRKLTVAERRAIATHPARGAEVLTPIAQFHPKLSEAVLAHHERWDGSGYPRGLRRERIPFAARVVMIADTFDAVTYSRRYRHGRSSLAAAEVILEERGTQFDPALVDLLLLPPVFDQIATAHRAAARAGMRIPNRNNGKLRDKAPKIRIRWRTRTEASKAVRRQLKETR